MSRLLASIPRRTAAFVAIMTAALLLVTAGAIESGKADAQPACTHGASSLGPISLSDGQVVGGSTTPTTEACLP